MAECTFQPKINPSDPYIQKLQSTSFEKRQQDWLNSRDIWRNTCKDQLDHKINRECTFSPNITNNFKNEYKENINPNINQQ